MDGVWVVGVATTPFVRPSGEDHRQLCDRAVRAALADAGADGAAVDHVVFGSCAMYAWGQPSVRGQIALLPLVESGLLGRRAPIVNVEAGCATGILALHGAARELQAGAALALAVGVDKAALPTVPEVVSVLEGATDRLDPEADLAWCRARAEEAGDRFDPVPHRSPILDRVAVVARQHRRRFGTTAEQLAAVVVKNRAHALHNPHALLRRAATLEEVLADRPVVDPFTRSMCCLPADGAAAVLLASSAALEAWPGLAARAVRLSGLGLAGGGLRSLHEPSETAEAARRAFASACRRPGEVDLAEVHDATASTELAALEALGLLPEGQAAAATAEGRTGLGGDLPVNPSGGLLGRGHPLAASGLAMVAEVVAQLRGEAGSRQVGQARVGVVQNAGGMVGFEEALCGVAVLDA